MDAKPMVAPEAPAASVRNVMRFEGSTSEYFKIWIVNIALTIVTLGIFSAWAKVRSKRYFYGNTYIGAHAFDYHAPPLRILLGRAIAVALLACYFLASVIAPAARALGYLVFLFALPWLIKSSLRFAARNTSYRNVRFNFHGTYWGALKAFLLWQALAVITLFTILPFSHRARDYYNINNHSFGQASFRAEIPIGKLYQIYFIGLALLIGVIVVATIPYGLLTPALGNAPGILWQLTIGATALISICIFLAIPAFLGAMTFNLAFGSMRLGEDFQFESRLSPDRMAWIVLSNFVLTLLSLGLLYPWARIRKAHYMADCIAVIGPSNIESFASAPVNAGSAVGEEVASFFDIDFGL